MSHVSSPGSSPEIAAVNPGYWGSLVALIGGMVIVLAMAIYEGVPTHARDQPTVFYAVLALVFFSSLRYYVAVSVHVYEGYGGAVLNWPRKLRVAGFLLLCAMIFTCNISVGAVSGVSLLLALVLCITLSLLSLLLFAGMWVAAEASSSFERPRLPVALGDVFLLTLLFIAKNAAADASPQALTIFWLVGLTTALLVGTEMLRLYSKPFLQQMRDLKAHLTS